MNLIQTLEAEQIAKLTAVRAIPQFRAGDTLRVGDARCELERQHHPEYITNGAALIVGVRVRVGVSIAWCYTVVRWLELPRRGHLVIQHVCDCLHHRDAVSVCERVDLAQCLRKCNLGRNVLRVGNASRERK